jgi:16S rRNA (cytosine1402-N4)-methyltransferase
MHVMRTQTHSTSPSDLGTHAETNVVHVPVLLQEVIDGLDIQPTDVLVDGTLGMAGHAKALATHLSTHGVFVGIDHDPRALKAAQQHMSLISARCIYAESSFENMVAILQQHKIPAVDKVLLDLGWGSHTLQSGKGFSFMKDEPLLMTYTDTVTDETLTAVDIINTWSEESLHSILSGYGEERHARRIAHIIVEERARRPIVTSGQLASLIERTIHRTGKTHPATQTFQALRIAVNDELGVLERTLKSITHVLAPNGRLAIITFHSIEDRLVKRYFKDLSAHGDFELITKKAIQPTRDELKVNPRARSAKLRVITKLS